MVCMLGVGRHGVRLGLCVAGLLVLMVSAGGCDDDEGDTTGDSADDDGGSTGDGGTPSTMTMTTATPNDGSTGEDPNTWVVGVDGEMLRVDADGSVDRYPLEIDTDFFGIACRGTSEAWVVGAAGTLLLTRDAGEHWSPVELPTSSDLRAVAAADSGPIWVVGEGVAFVSSDGGDDWQAAAVPERAWTGVAVAPHGAYAILSDAAGELWRLPANGVATAVWRGAEPLRDVAVGAHGTVAVAVGDLGTLVRSDDAGAHFEPAGLATAADLHAVEVAHAGALVLAVGAGGTVARIDAEGGTTVQTLLDPALALRAVHVADGEGHVLGDAGLLFRSLDDGESWSPVALPTMLTLHGIDHPGLPHD